MKLISWNVNGIRAVERKEVLQPLIKKYQPDVAFFQEVKAQAEQLSDYLLNNDDYYQFYQSAEKKGYSGVGVWVSKKLSEQEPTVTRGMAGWNDSEGRVIAVDIGEYTMLGIYFPNGGKSDEAWQGKLKFYDHFLKHVNKLRKAGRKVIWAGDLNVAHQPVDLARPKENDGAVGFHPDERAWFDRVLADGWVDTFRHFFPERVSYTWWRQASRARERNIGWRIDYFMVDKALMQQVKEADHDNDHQGSDHCPIFLQLN